jgi:hypothetical protein
MDTAFLNAGADFFILKPILASKKGLARVLVTLCLESDAVEAEGGRF